MECPVKAVEVDPLGNLPVQRGENLLDQHHFLDTVAVHIHRLHLANRHRRRPRLSPARLQVVQLKPGHDTTATLWHLHEPFRLRRAAEAAGPGRIDRWRTGGQHRIFRRKRVPGGSHWQVRSMGRLVSDEPARELPCLYLAVKQRPLLGCVEFLIEQEVAKGPDNGFPVDTGRRPRHMRMGSDHYICSRSDIAPGQCSHPLRRRGNQFTTPVHVDCNRRPGTFQATDLRRQLRVVGCQKVLPVAGYIYNVRR